MAQRYSYFGKEYDLPDGLSKDEAIAKIQAYETQQSMGGMANTEQFGQDKAPAPRDPGEEVMASDIPDKRAELPGAGSSFSDVMNWKESAMDAGSVVPQTRDEKANAGEGAKLGLEIAANAAMLKPTVGAVRAAPGLLRQFVQLPTKAKLAASAGTAWQVGKDATKLGVANKVMTEMGLPSEARMLVLGAYGLRTPTGARAAGDIGSRVGGAAQAATIERRLATTAPDSAKYKTLKAHLERIQKQHPEYAWLNPTRFRTMGTPGPVKTAEQIAEETKAIDSLFPAKDVQVMPDTMTLEEFLARQLQK